MRRCCLETRRLLSQLASSFYHGRPSVVPPTCLPHRRKCPRMVPYTNAHVADQDDVLFNDPKCGHVPLLAYFFSSPRRAQKHPPFMCKRTFPHAPAHTAMISYVLSDVHICTLTQTSSTNARARTNGAVIKNKTMGFLKAPRTEGKSQQRSSEKSPPGNNEENDHLLFLKSR